MVSIPLLSGAYSSQSRIADAQRSINLYAEVNPKETQPAMPVTQYPRPGLTVLSNPPVQGFGRCLYGANNGDLYAVINQTVYYIDPNWTWQKIGLLALNATTPVSMSDNGTDAIIVDGSPQGYQIDFSNRSFSAISDQNFYGSTRADFLDSFIILNKPGTNEWYCSQSDQLVFNGLFVGVKTAWPDNILCVVAIEREVYVLGPKKSEVWFNAGNSQFPFDILSGNIIEQGCAAQYSPAKMDTNVYWLSQSPEGDRMVMRGNLGNVAQRISTHAIESEFRSYARIDDAIGATYQVSGHYFYKLHFPTADRTWGFDAATEQWHEDLSMDINGKFHRARNTFCAFAYGKNVGLDWQTGALYHIDPAATQDNGQPIVCVRSFPHLTKELLQTSYASFTADIATGTSVNTGNRVQILTPWSDGFSQGFGPLTQSNIPQIAVRFSKNGGYNFGNYRIKTLASSGDYRRMMRWRSFGIARDAVFELNFTADVVSALNGGYTEPLSGSS